MSAQLICTEQGKRLHLGVYYVPYWAPVCAQPSGDNYVLSTGAVAGGRNRGVCSRCMVVVAELSALAASTEER